MPTFLRMRKLRVKDFILFLISFGVFTMIYFERKYYNLLNFTENVEEKKVLTIPDRWNFVRNDVNNSVKEKSQIDLRNRKKTLEEYLNQEREKQKEVLNPEILQPQQPTCKHTIYRDYKKDPVTFGNAFSRLVCDIPCEKPSGNSPADIGGTGSCIHQKRFSLTMENIGSLGHGDNHSILSTTRLTSDVPVQYFSWAEYGFMNPPKPKNKDYMMVALISNCGPQYRLKYLKELMNYGVRVQSFGSCLRNAEIPSDNYNNRLQLKKEIISKFKFTFAFENSEAPDYVTEKMFGPLEAGSVPVYYGAPNSKKFAPNNHSVIFASDFRDAKELAEYLKLLDSNDELYNEYLKWKFEGPDKEWIALIDLGIVHSACRFCIRSADIDRITVGEVRTGPFEEENQLEMQQYQNTNAKMFKIRERGTFWLRRIHLETETIVNLKNKIQQKYKGDQSSSRPETIRGEIISIYRLWDRYHTPIVNNSQLKDLSYGTELEVIFENPGSLDRHSYTKWWYEKHYPNYLSKLGL